MNRLCWFSFTFLCSRASSLLAFFSNYFVHLRAKSRSCIDHKLIKHVCGPPPHPPTHFLISSLPSYWKQLQKCEFMKRTDSASQSMCACVCLCMPSPANELYQSVCTSSLWIICGGSGCQWEECVCRRCLRGAKKTKWGCHYECHAGGLSGRRGSFKCK